MNLFKSLSKWWRDRAPPPRRNRDRMDTFEETEREILKRSLDEYSERIKGDPCIMGFGGSLSKVAPPPIKMKHPNYSLASNQHPPPAPRTRMAEGEDAIEPNDDSEYYAWVPLEALLEARKRIEILESKNRELEDNKDAKNEIPEE